MEEYVFEIPIESRDALAAIRLMRGLRVAERGDSLWLRGVPHSEKLPKEIWQIRTQHIFTLDKENYLFPIGTKVPVAKLVEMSWMPLQRYISIEPPVSAMKGEMNTTVEVKLIPSAKVHSGQALLTDLNQWKAYADSAPATRLKRLSFAVSERNQVLLLGTPIPPLPGREYWMTNELLLPCGYDFEISLMASLLPRLLNPENDSLILFEPDGSWQKISKNNFVATTRSAVRMTKGTLTI